MSELKTVSLCAFLQCKLPPSAPMLFPKRHYSLQDTSKTPLLVSILAAILLVEHRIVLLTQTFSEPVAYGNSQITHVNLKGFALSPTRQHFPFLFYNFSIVLRVFKEFCGLCWSSQDFLCCMVYKTPQKIVWRTMSDNFGCRTTIFETAYSVSLRHTALNLDRESI